MLWLYLARLTKIILPFLEPSSSCLSNCWMVYRTDQPQPVPFHWEIARMDALVLESSSSSQILLTMDEDVDVDEDAHLHEGDEVSMTLM